MNFACPKCKQATVISITALKLDTFECYHCNEKLYAGALPKLVYKLSKEFTSFSKSMPTHTFIPG